MIIKEVIYNENLKKNIKLSEIQNQFERLIEELKGKNLSDSFIHSINSKIDAINSINDSDKILKSQIKKNQAEIIKQLEKENKIVLKNHYRNTWLALGMSVFGIPMGVAFGATLGNMGLVGIGLPIGMAIGIAIGTAKDKKAGEEGRQLDFEIKY